LFSFPVLGVCFGLWKKIRRTYISTILCLLPVSPFCPDDNTNNLNNLCLTSFQQQNTGWVVRSLSQRALQAQNKDSFTDPILVLDDLLLLQDKGLLLKSQQKRKHLK